MPAQDPASRRKPDSWQRASRGDVWLTSYEFVQECVPLIACQENLTHAPGRTLDLLESVNGGAVVGVGVLQKELRLGQDSGERVCQVVLELAK